MPIRFRWSRFWLAVGLAAAAPWFVARSGPAYWEHAPVGAETRLPRGESPVWEFAVLLTDAGPEPARITFPAGMRIVLHVQNTTSAPWKLTFTGTPGTTTVPADGYRRLAFGPSPAGDLLWSGRPLSPADAPSRHGVLRSGTWPQNGELVYHAAWIMRPEGLVPATLLLPAGRACAISVAGSVHDRPALWRLPGCRVEFYPGRITVARPAILRGGRLAIRLRARSPAEIRIR